MGSARSRGHKCGLPFGLTPCAPKARKHPTPRRRPQSAEFIGTAFYEPEVILEMCKSDVARGEVGFCTGYVIATQRQMAGAGEVCMPPRGRYEKYSRWL